MFVIPKQFNLTERTSRNIEVLMVYIFTLGLGSESITGSFKWLWSKDAASSRLNVGTFLLTETLTEN